MNNCGAYRIRLKAERELSCSSPDYFMPWGTRRETSRNRRFNEKLYDLYPLTKQLKILDIGCAGGGFVKDCIDDGHVAVGLEGSDYSKKCGRGEWTTVPFSLFTCDVTGNFELLMDKGDSLEPVRFDVVTCWELMEHIAESDLDKMIANTAKHLAPGGLWIMSIATVKDVIDGVNLHQTVRPKSWWIEKFKQHKLEHLEEFVDYFNTQFVRGPKYGAKESFHLVLSPDKTSVPSVYRLKLSTKIFDWWLGSGPQRIVRRLVVGP